MTQKYVSNVKLCPFSWQVTPHTELNIMPANQKHKHTSLNIKDKLKILEELKINKTSRKQLSVNYQIDLSTIARIVKNEKHIRDCAVKNQNINRKRMRKGSHDEIDVALKKWFHEKRNHNAIITGPMLLEQAKKFAQILNVDNFEPNTGWLHRWKIRENINFHRLVGEKNDADQTGAQEWCSTVLPTLLKNFSPDCIYNAD